MENETAAIAPTTPTPAPTPAETPAPANNPTPQNEPGTALKASDIANMTPEQLDQLTQEIGNLIPRETKTGKAVLEVGETESAPEDVVPPEEPEVPAEPAPEVEPEVVPEVEPEVPVKPEPDPEEVPEQGKLPQQRLRAANPVEDMALTLYRKANAAGKKMSLSEAESEAKRVLGVTDAPAPVVQSKTVETAQTELAALREQRKTAKVAFDADTEETLTSQIEDKLEEIRDIKQDNLARHQAEQHRTTSIIENARIEAKKLYPGLLDDGQEGRPFSEIAKSASQIHDALVANGDPAVNAPDYLLDLARRAAKATSTPPAVNGKTPTASKPVPPRSVQPAKPTAPLLSASARTTPTGKVQTTAAVISGLKGNQRALDDIISAFAAQMER